MSRRGSCESRLGVALAVALIGTVSAALLGVPASASAAKITGPKRVVPGKPATFKITGLRPNFSFGLWTQPASTPKNRPGRDGWTVLKDLRGRELRSDGSGRATVRVRFPRRRLQCGASCADQLVPWKRGSWVDIWAQYAAEGPMRPPFARTRAKIAPLRP